MELVVNKHLPMFDSVEVIKTCRQSIQKKKDTDYSQITNEVKLLIFH